MNASNDVRLRMARQHRRAGRVDEAELLLTQLLMIDPSNAAAYVESASLQLFSGRPDSAEENLHTAIHLEPGNRDAHHLLGCLYRMQLRHEDSVGAFKRATSCHPENLSDNADFVFSLLYSQTIDPFEGFGFIRSVGQHLQEIYPKLFLEYEPPGDRIRIGYLGSQMWSHSVSYFLLPLLARHSDQFQVYCYNVGEKQDSVTEKIKARSHCYRHLSGADIQVVAETIHGDGIDILIDLDGYTGIRTLCVLSHKPAPLQASWVGFAGTTGLDRIDYRIVDQITDPVSGISDSIHTEKLIRMPRIFSVYEPPPTTPNVADTPALVNGYITFGCFNNPYKLNTAVIDVWSKILQAVPRSKLILKNKWYKLTTIRDSVIRRFSEHGISDDRICIIGGEDEAQTHFRRYNDIDIALDPFPYSGTTTTCDALWMGVPVITLAGDKHISRVGVSQLSNIGLQEFIATDPGEYVRLASRHAEDAYQLNELRRGMRNRLARSPLMDAEAFTSDFEFALCEIWQRYISTASNQANG